MNYTILTRSSFLAVLLSVVLVSLCLPSRTIGSTMDAHDFLNVYTATGEEGLRSYALNVKASLTAEIVLYYAAEGVNKKNSAMLTVARLLAETAGDPKILAEVYMKFALYGQAMHDNSYIDTSLAHARVLFNELNDIDGVSTVLKLQGEALLRSGNVATALDLYQKAVETHLFINQPVRCGDVFKDLADLLISVGRLSLAFEQYRKAALYYENAGNHHGAGLVHFIIGEQLLRQLQPAEALAEYERALERYSKTDDILSQGNALLRIGEIAIRQGDYVRAFTVFSRAAGCFQKLGNSAALATVNDHLANLAAVRGDATLRAGNHKEALDYFKKGLEYVGSGTADAAVLHRKIASVYLLLKDTIRATESMHSALAVYEKLGDLSAVATVYKMFGDLYAQEGKYSEALDAFSRAGALYRQLGDQQGAGNVLRRTGDVLYFSADKNRALESYEAALDCFRSTNDLKGQATIFRILGEIQMQQGASVMALKNYAKSLELYEQYGDIPGMKLVYRGQAEALMRMGDNAKALELQTKAAELSDNSESMLERANKSRVQADIYARAGDTAMATEWYGDALKLYRKAGDLSGEGNVIRSLGDIYVNMGDFPRALLQFETALPLLEKTNDLAGQGNIYQMQGYIAYTLGKYDQALQLYARARAIFETSHNQLGLINVQKGNAEVYAARHDFKIAKQLFRSVLDFYISVGDLEAQAYTLFSLAQISVQEESKATALDYYQQSLALLEKIRKQSGYSRLKKRFMEKVYDLYEEAVVFMIGNNFSAEAMRYAEAMKARVFIDQLAEGHVVFKNGEPQALKEKRELLRERFATLDQKVADLTMRGESGATLDSLRKTMIEVEKEIDALDINLRTGNSLYASVHYPEPISVQALQEKVLHGDETLLEFFVSSEGVYCFIVTGTDFKSFKLPLTRKELDQMSKDLLGAVDKGPSRSSGQFEDFAATLYDRLLLPLEKVISHNKVIIVPDGILTRIPFEVLTRRDKGLRQFFLERNTIKYFQSATLLALQRTQFRKEKFSSSFIGFGDPVYDYNSSAGKRSDVIADAPSAAAEIRLVRLEASGKEVLEISEIFAAESRPAKVLLRDNASRKNAMSDEMKNYGFIHFAAHGIKSGGYQAIALSRTLSSSDNGMLSIGDIMSSSYEKSRVVVLSACQSGLGTFDRGEGVTGLTRAVMYAGSPAAVVSLWNVEDRGTMVLMENFYENVISKKMDIDQALRSAKLAMLKSDRYGHPIFWGSFVMYGE